jgi:hypothetical protein
MGRYCYHYLFAAVTTFIVFIGSASAAPTSREFLKGYLISMLPVVDIESEAPESNTGKNSGIDPYHGKRRLTFRADGTFKMTVFSDLHFGENPWDDWGPQQDVNSTRLMRAVLTSEKPDYVSVMRPASSVLARAHRWGTAF